MNELVELKERFEVIIRSTEEFPVDFDEAWQWVGYGRKDYALDTLKANFKEGPDYSALKWNRAKQDGIFDSGLNRNQKPGRGGDRKSVLYSLSVDCFKAFCMMAGTQRGKEVRMYYIQLEKFWNTPEAVMERARQMGAVPRPEPYVCCYPFFNDPRNLRALGQLSRLVDSGKISRLEFRKIMFGPDAQDIEPDPMVRAKDLRLAVGKGLATKEEYRLAMGLPAEMKKTAKPDVAGSFIKFASAYIELTGNKEDFIIAHDLYERYKAVTEAPISLWSFTYSLKGNFPGVIHKQKKIDRYPTLCYFGIRYKDTAGEAENG